MSVLIAMTGLRAAQTDLTVTSNNIANVGTIGFHSSRADFGDLYSQSPYTVAKTQQGQGASINSIKGNFAQGAVEQTANTLDLAIEGQGFFLKKSSLQHGEPLFSRAGSFGLDDQGYVVDNTGNYLMFQKTAEDGSPLTLTSGQIEPMQINMQKGPAEKTTTVEMVANFSSGLDGAGTQDAVPPSAPFNQLQDATYAHKTPMKVLDEMGQPLDAYAYFVKTKEPDAVDQTTGYDIHVVIDDQQLNVPAGQTNSIVFDEFGQPTAAIPLMNFSSMNYDVAVSLTGSELSNEPFAVESYVQDGQTLRGLSSLQVDDEGLLWASYMGEDAIALGQIAMANFNNPHGLARVGSATYMQTLESGDPLLGTANQGGFGKLRASALEGSNVELTNELVNLIKAQRNYQASAKALETSSSLAQTILNIRG